MDRALNRQSLEAALPAARVTVQSLGQDGQVLQAQVIRVPDPVLVKLREGLARSGEGFRALAGGVRYLGESEIEGTETDHVTGNLKTAALARAADRAGDAGGIAGAFRSDRLRDGLAGARFDLYAARPEGDLERLDLTLTFNPPDNAVPPTRIRFTMTGESPNPSE